MTRTATLAGNNAARRVKLGPLPLSIDDGSVRVEVKGDSVVASDLRVVLEVPDLDVSLSPAKPEEVREMQFEIARLLSLRKQLQRETELIESIGVIERPDARPGRRPPPSPAAARLALLDLRANRLKKLDAGWQTVAEDLRVAAEKLDALHERDRKASSARRAEKHELRKAIVVSLRREDGAAADATIELSYRVMAAFWAPSYVLRLAPELGRGELEVRAVLCQRSGEDWDGVRLTLSTAELRGWAELPELASVRIGRRQPPSTRRGWRPPPVGVEALFSDLDRSRVHRAPPAPSSARMPVEPEPSLDESILFGDVAEQAASAPLQTISITDSVRHYDEALESDLDDLGDLGDPRGQPAGAAIPTGAAMPTQAAPAPGAAPQMLRAQAKSGGIAGLIGSAAHAAGAVRGGKAKKGKRRRAAGGGAAKRAAIQASTELSVQEQMLNYGRLYLPASDSARRGKLVFEARRERYVRLVEEMRIAVDIDGAFAQVERQVERCHRTALPPGHRPLAPSGFDYAYHADAPISAASDGTFHNIALMGCEGAANAHFVVVPRESRDAFRFVELDNPLDAPLLLGPVDVYVGEDFLLTSTVREVPPRGKLRLGLGVEQRIKVSRNARFEEESGGLIGGRLDLHHEIEIDVDNQLPRTADVAVRERLPVLREDEDDIKIEIDKVSPRWKPWEPKEQPELDGGYVWRIQIEPGASEKMLVRYTVKIGSKNELVGGNRRES